MFLPPQFYEKSHSKLFNNKHVCLDGGLEPHYELLGTIWQEKTARKNGILTGGVGATCRMDINFS